MSLTHCTMFIFNKYPIYAKITFLGTKKAQRQTCDFFDSLIFNYFARVKTFSLFAHLQLPVNHFDCNPEVQNLLKRIRQKCYFHNVIEMLLWIVFLSSDIGHLFFKRIYKHLHWITIILFEITYFSNKILICRILKDV